MLSFRHLMVGSLNLKTHFFEGFDDLTTAVIAGILGIKRKITGNIIGDSGGQPVLVFFEQEEFRFGSNIHGISQVSWLRPEHA